MSRGWALIVMAKAPRPGLAKTRLSPALGAAGAAALAEHLLRATLREAVQAGAGTVELCVAPDPSDPLWREFAGTPAIVLAAQGEGDLGQRMQRALARQLRRHDAALIIGTDAPALDAELLARAAAALHTHDVVVVPAHDGGYALLGLKRADPRLFDDVAWSTPAVLAQTRQRLAGLGWRHAELPPVHDVDEPADLAHVLHCWGHALPDNGLAHVHLRLPGTGRLARLPKQSQIGLSPDRHLAYEAASFERAAASGHVPRLHAVLPPGDALPRGGLIVDEVAGRAARLPQDLPAIVQALAAIHCLPPPADPAPLRAAADPLHDLLLEIASQAVHADAAGLEPFTAQAIAQEVAALRSTVARHDRPPSTLISFDAHPGNFIVRDDGRAVLVDLEKARYGPPALDLAHATLYTSTTWDLGGRAELGVDEVAGAYRDWASRVGAARAALPWAVPLRRAMWLWSLTWCAKWRVLSRRQAADGGEDWSAQRSDPTLVAHVQERVDHYLSPQLVQRLLREFDQLAGALASL